ncbi:MAG: hypothetical protein ACRDTT_30230, partial [Pseudonocardiaceae bacterium]
VTTLLEHRNLPYVSWDGWRRLDAYEIGLGRAAGKERVKVADRATMLRVALPAVRERSAS